MFALVFGGLSVASFVTFFVSRPLRSLEENLNFITWLGVIYNSYWARIVYALNTETRSKQDLKAITEDFVAQIERLIERNNITREDRGSEPKPNNSLTGSPEVSAFHKQRGRLSRHGRPAFCVYVIRQWPACCKADRIASSVRGDWPAWAHGTRRRSVPAALIAVFTLAGRFGAFDCIPDAQQIARAAPAAAHHDRPLARRPTAPRTAAGHAVRIAAIAPSAPSSKRRIEQGVDRGEDRALARPASATDRQAASCRRRSA